MGVDRLAVSFAREPGDQLLFAGALDGFGTGDRLDAVRDLRARQAPRDARVVRRRHEENARSLLAGAPRPPAPVRVGLDVGRRLDLNDPGDVADVDPAGGDVGRDEGLHPPLPEGRQRPIALRLFHFPRERSNDEPCLGELAGDPGHVGPGAHEHERLRVFVREQQVDERVDPLARLDEVHHVRDVRVGLAETRSLDVHRILLEAIGQGHHVAREGRRHEVRPSLLREHREDRLEVFSKAEVEHRVGFVEHDGREVRGVDLRALEGVAQAPGRRDDHRRVRRERALLVDVSGAARDARDPHAKRRVEPGQLFGHLLGELSRRGQDEHPGPGGPAALRREVVEQIADHEPDGDGLAGAGLRRHPEVAALERLVENGLLDGRECFVALRGQRRGERGPDELGEVSPGHRAAL